MRLRRQLLLVSLFILGLPWAGCQHIRQMEAAMRDGQARALTATARAVAARLESEANYIDQPEHPAIYSAEQQIYLHPLRSHATVDGYDAEWRALDVQPRVFDKAQFLQARAVPAQEQEQEQSETTRVESVAGWFDESIYLFFSIHDNSHEPHHPQQGGIANGDHLVLRALEDRFNLREYVFRAGGNGAVVARYLNADGAIRQEHRIRGEWREVANGYRVELRLPMSLAPLGLDFYYVNASQAGGASRGIGNYNPADYPAPWRRSSASLAQVLEAYTDDALRISVLDAHQWLLARAGNLSDAARQEEGASPFLAWLYRMALGREDFPVLDDPRRSGRLTAPEVDAAFAGNAGFAWYRNGPQRVGRAVVPVKENGRLIGAVAVEQSTDSLLAETNTAFNQLFLYTALATGLAAFGLLAYASWLSWRIRRLNRAADAAIGDDGKIRPDLVSSRAGDEIGDLTRSYSRLLGRLRDYTDYLRSLSGKLSHELRTPLAVMKSSLDNLEHESLSENASTYIQRARDASQRLSGILNAMSSASRMEESIQQAQTERFPLDDLLRNLVAAYRETWPGRCLALTIEGDGPWELQASPDLLVQMLDKLVDNALDFCPPEGSIELALAQRDKGLVLSVSNDGPPLPEHMQKQLFDSLVSVRETTGSKDNKSHLGLGLYIVRLIADFHRGRVSARNRPDGSGVRFEIWLPLD